MTPLERITRGAPGRREADHAWYVRVWHFALAPLVDHYKGLSLTRILAVMTMAVVWMTAFHEHTLTWVMFWLVLAALAAAFGKGVFIDLLSRIRLGVSGSESTARADVTETVRADLHYTAEGVPAFSNPAVPGARTRSGDD